LWGDETEEKTFTKKNCEKKTPGGRSETAYETIEEQGIYTDR